MTYYKEISLSTWAEFKKKAEEPRPQWIFRGQSNANWDLQTTLERSTVVSDSFDFEDELVNEFKRGAKFYLKEEQQPTTLLEWFSMIQHFGAPSRLLDFTKSPYVAAYFAFEQASLEAENVAIWIVDKIYLYQKAVYFFEGKISNINSNHYAFKDETFEEVFEKSKEGDFNCLFPVEPRNVNQRYHLQQSIFLCQGNPYESLMNQLDFIGDIQQKTIMKVTIPTIEKNNAIRDLIKMNISAASLFPGLDGFAKSLISKYSNLLTLGDL